MCFSLNAKWKGLSAPVFMVVLDVMEKHQAGAAEHQCRDCGLTRFLIDFGWFLQLCASWKSLPSISDGAQRDCKFNRFPEVGRLISSAESKSRWSEIPSIIRKLVLKGQYLNSHSASHPFGSTIPPSNFQAVLQSLGPNTVNAALCADCAQEWRMAELALRYETCSCCNSAQIS